MKIYSNLAGRTAFRLVAGPAAVLAVACAATQACTIFVLTDRDQVLFGNNEDWSNPKTKRWFIPNTEHCGCIFVGFGNGWGQGGTNPQGAAFDWVAGFKEEWKRDRKPKQLFGNPDEAEPEALPFPGVTADQ